MSEAARLLTTGAAEARKGATKNNKDVEKRIVNVAVAVTGKGVQSLLEKCEKLEFNLSQGRDRAAQK
jgi:hypothetical protein